MKHHPLSVLLVAALLVAPGAVQPRPSAQAAPAASPRYTVTDLGALGRTTTKAMGVNETGLVVGASQSGSYRYGFLWDNGIMTNLGDLSGRGSWTYDIDDAG